MLVFSNEQKSEKGSGKVARDEGLKILHANHVVFVSFGGCV
jgi:hypothetical protein